MNLEKADNRTGRRGDSRSAARFFAGDKHGAGVLGIYIVVQQVESYLIMPIVHREMVFLPSALTLFAVVAFGVIFGLTEVLLATPLTVTAYVAVKKLYVRDALHERPCPEIESEFGVQAGGSALRAVGETGTAKCFPKGGLAVRLFA